MIYSSSAIDVSQRLGAGLQCLQQGRLEEAWRAFSEVIAADPANAMAFHLRGLVYLQAGQAQNRFFTELEDSLSLNVIDAPLDTRVAADARDLAAASEPANARAATAAIANLAEGVQGLVHHMRQEQQQIRDWVEAQAATQRDLKAAIDKLAAKVEKR